MELKAFVNFPWEVYGTSSQWVPPLKSEVCRLLDKNRHPYWRFSDQMLLLAQKNGEIRGRIAGIIDHNFNAYHGQKCCIWGFFECLDDPDAASALFSSVKRWALHRKMDFLLGPFNPSTNYEAGLLVDGFDHPPALMMTYNPPYYAPLIESCGFRKEKDLLSFFIGGGYRPPQWLNNLSERFKRISNLWARPVRKKEFRAEAALIRKIYHEAWSGNWGFVPTTEEEFQLIAKNVTRVLDEDLAFFLFCGEEPAGIALILPDLNPLLKRLNGRIGPSGLWKIMRYRKEINGARGFMFGIRKRYQDIGLPVVALDYLMKKIEKGDRFKYFEFGWTLEDNESINQWLLDGGMKVHNRYRVFRLDL